MLRRIVLLTRVRLSGEWFGEQGGSLPIAPLVFQGVVASGILWLVQGDLDVHAHGVFALTLLFALTMLSLLGELAPLLALDPAEEWVAGLPVTHREVRLSKIAVCLLVSLGMSLSVLVPAMLLAPETMDWGSRFGLLGLGWGLVIVATALALLLHALLQGRRSGGLVFLQAALFVSLFVVFVGGLGRAGELSGWTHAQGAWLALPSVWLAGPLAPDPTALATWLGLGALLLAVVILFTAPFPQKAQAVGTQSVLGTLLLPLRALARRAWVRPAERPIFDWIYAGLPAEKDFGLRTYPLMAIPFAFLFLGASGTQPDGVGLLAILAFAPLTYLPILLLFVPTTQTPAARVVVDVTPVAPEQEREGALKAVAVRILVPLYVLLAAVVVGVAGWSLCLHLIPTSAALTVIALRPLWKHYVEKPPLSTPAQDLGGVWRDDLTGGMFVMVVFSVLAALLTWRFVPGPRAGLALGAGLLAIEVLRHGPLLRSTDRHAEQRAHP